MATKTTLKLNTPVDAGKSKIAISLHKPTLILGSCFAENIGNAMVTNGFDAVVNPLGTIYNPVSLLNSLTRISAGIPFSADECVAIGAGDGRICSFNHHTSNARKTVDEFLDHVNGRLAAAHEHWEKTELLIVTLGTAWCFRHVETGFVVTNCLKHPANEFSRFRLSVGECGKTLEKVMDIVKGRDVIFTVSPIRHLADGAHGNALSKATLLMGIEATMERHTSNAAYFPSYEIMTDELRDYRFYADDMTHPSKLAEGYIFDRFMDFALPDAERQELEENIKRAKRLAHRDIG